MKHFYIVSTFRNELNFDTNFYNLMNEKILLKDKYNIKAKLVAGTFNNIIDYALLINDDVMNRRQVKRIAREYFQDCYLEIKDSDAYFMSKGLVQAHMTWLLVTKKEALKGGDYTYFIKEDEFYICL